MLGQACSLQVCVSVCVCYAGLGCAAQITKCCPMCPVLSLFLCLLRVLTAVCPTPMLDPPCHLPDTPTAVINTHTHCCLPRIASQASPRVKCEQLHPQSPHHTCSSLHSAPRGCRNRQAVHAPNERSSPPQLASTPAPPCICVVCGSAAT